MMRQRTIYDILHALLRKGAVVCVLLLALAGCRPKGVLSSREMRDVLYDLHRADGAIQVSGYNYSHDEELAACYKSVLDKHGITQAQFDSSLVWYTDNPQIFNKIYPKVVARLEADLATEQALRDGIPQQVVLTPAEEPATAVVPVKPFDQLQREYLRGLDTHWTIWVPDTVPQKTDTFIFGTQDEIIAMSRDSVCI